MTIVPPAPESSPEQPVSKSEFRALLAEKSYLCLLCARFLASMGVQIQSVNLGWQVYTLAREGRDVKEAALILSLIGLVQFIPVLCLTLVAGQVADRHNRRNIMAFSLMADIVSTVALGVLAMINPTLWPIFVIAALFGCSRAFLMPAGGSMAPMLVPRHLMPRALAWSSLGWQTASVVGPAVGGLIIGPLPMIFDHFTGGHRSADQLHTLGVTMGYVAPAILYAVAIGFLMLIRKNTTPEHNPGSRLEMIKEGLAYVWREKIVFGAISLDLFAVLLGGATLLLPVFAADVLHVGPEGFGLLRAAPGVGAALVAIYLAANPVKRKAGLVMFSGVAVFAVSTIVFGLSKSLPLTLVALAVLGGADMLSVYIRQTLVQIVTPDTMRGRVAAVSSLFVGASNELGEFESGVVARFLGPVGAAVFGGCGALIVTGVWAKLFPALRKADRLG